MGSLAERMESAEAGYVIEGRGLVVLRPLDTLTDWEAIGHRLAERIGSAQWAIGDWILLHRGEFGDRYTAACRVTGLAVDTCRSMAKTAETFPLEMRVPATLPFSFFRYTVAAPAEERPRLLFTAASEGW